MSQQTVLSNQLVDRMPTELQCVERCVFMKEVNAQNLCNFELGTQEGINIPIWIIIGFQQSDRQNSQNENFIVLSTSSNECPMYYRNGKIS